MTIEGKLGNLQNKKTLRALKKAGFTDRELRHMRSDQHSSGTHNSGTPTGKYIFTDDSIAKNTSEPTTSV